MAPPNRRPASARPAAPESREPATGDHAGSRRRLQVADEGAPALTTCDGDVEQPIGRRAVGIVAAQVVIGDAEALSRAIDDDKRTPLAPSNGQRSDERWPVNPPAHGHHDCSRAGTGGRVVQEDVACSDRFDCGRRKLDWFERRSPRANRQEEADEQGGDVRIVGDETDEALAGTCRATDTERGTVTKLVADE